MKNFVNWAILAPGTIANSMATAMQGAISKSKTGKQIRTYAVASRSNERAKEFAARFNFKKAYGSYEELFEDSDVDAVYIANPHAFHHDSAIQALNNGKHVLCEKPAGCSVNQLQNMIFTAKKNNLFFMEAMWTAFNPTILNIIKIIKNGEIGQLKHIESRFCNRIPYDPKHRLYAPELAGGALLDLGIYNIYFAMMINDFLPIINHSSAVRMLNGVDVWNSINLTFQNNVTTSFQSAADMPAGSDTHDAIIFGTKGFITVKNFFMTEHAKLHLYKSESGNNNKITKKLDIPFMINGYEYELIHATECILAGKTDSHIHTWEKTKKLCNIMDTLRKDWSMKYAWE
ncbi:MAG: Gfo/Idh/MocA family oxidoreductase [Treponema sp.]|jgi:predicted dehydrogenase|nr:Gfo/Idh/MocA family oxidoreductase [Treponema sp.]